ncbi:MAG: right-handed parallel beta-helix repeat-containing protein [Streptosporangiales bacterium]
MQGDSMPPATPGRRTGGWQRRGAALAGGLALVAGLAWVITAANRPTDPPSAASSGSSATAPASPTAEVCDNGSMLDGPQQPPADAVSVSTSDNLAQITNDNPPGTTFWLAAGVHELSPTTYAQVHPKDHDTYIGAPGAVLDGRHRNRYAFGGHAADVTIKYLTIKNFGTSGGNNNEGVVNHNSATGWQMVRNTVRDNAGAGVMLGSKNVLRENCLAHNGQYGFSAYHPDGVNDLTLVRNEIAGNNTDDWEQRRPGCGCSGGGKFWDVDGAVVRGNWVHDNKSAGLWADTNNVGFAFTHNYFSDNDAEAIIYEISYNAVIRDNTFVRNGNVKGPENPGFPTAAIYLSESGSDSRVPGPYSSKLEVEDNVFKNNWSGVILWENADRFAGSPANTSTGASTLVNPKVTADSCNAKNIDQEPYYSDCRWKTKNVRVHDNRFSFDPDEVGPQCVTDRGCGYNGIMSNWGTYPDWSPYKGDVIQQRITFKQGNRFFDNTYSGPWRFLVRDQDTSIVWSTWRSQPYQQDAHSTIAAAASPRGADNCSHKQTKRARCHPAPSGSSGG